MPISDATLVLGARAGDRGAFAELYDRRARLIRAICFDATGDLDVAADLTQDVFLRAYRKLGRLRNPRRFAPWLVGIARQVCREWHRSQRRERSRVERFAMQSALMHDDEDDSERIERLQHAVAELPEKQRFALHAFYLEKMDVEKARGALGLSRSGFYRLLSAARERLHRRMTVAEGQV